MTRTRGLAVLIATLSAIGAACDDSQSARPIATGPTPVSPARTGQISLRSIAPASGATLLMQDCTYEPEESGPNTQICTGASITVDMEVDTSMQARVVAYFYRGTQICAVSWGSFEDTRVIGMNIISLTDMRRPEEVLTTTANRCPLPIVTTHIVLKAVERSEFPLVNPLRLTSQEFPHTYTFDVPASLRALP